MVVPPAVQREVNGLAGKRAGYGMARTLLGIDPCHPDLKAYRLSGPLEPVVCGTHLQRGYRLAFTTQPAQTPDEDDRLRVVILYVGKREAGHRSAADVWDVLHDLFNVENPPSGHDKPPCCEEGLPMLPEGDLDSFVTALRRLQRRR